MDLAGNRASGVLTTPDSLPNGITPVGGQSSRC
jgi:hypothetical protein